MKVEPDEEICLPQRLTGNVRVNSAGNDGSAWLLMSINKSGYMLGRKQSLITVWKDGEKRVLLQPSIQPTYRHRFENRLDRSLRHLENPFTFMLLLPVNIIRPK